MSKYKVLDMMIELIRDEIESSRGDVSDQILDCFEAMNILAEKLKEASVNPNVIRKIMLYFAESLREVTEEEGWGLACN